jgi:hypothetical protein
MKLPSNCRSKPPFARLGTLLTALIALVQIVAWSPRANAATTPLTNTVFSIDTIPQLLALTPAQIPGCTPGLCEISVHVTDPLRGGIFTLTNTIVGTNMGTLIASTGFSGWSWQREYVGPMVVTWFGTRGAPYDDTIPISNAIAAAETGVGGVVYFPEGTYRAQGLHVHRCYLQGAGMTIGPWSPATMLELVPNATSDLLYFDEASVNDNQLGSGISDMTLNGHRSANLINPVTITGSTDRNTFTVDPTTLPSTLVDDGTWTHYSFCFFYTDSNRYVGYGLVQAVNSTTGQITLLAGYDRYATVNSTDSLPAGWKVCFTPNRSTTLPYRFGGGFAQTFNDPVAAGRSGIVISSANVNLENVCVWDFHTGIAGYTASGAYFKNIWCQNNGFAGIANADVWAVDSKFERLFVQGYYYEYPGEAAENPKLANYTWRHTAYGVYGFWGESAYSDISVAACVVDVGDTGGEGTDISYLLLDVPIKSGISSLNSLSHNQSVRIGTLDARSWGDFGITNGHRQLPSNQGMYAVLDGVAGGRYYSIGKLGVNSFDYVSSNWFSTVFNYYSTTTNSPVSIGELVEFNGSTNWWIGGGLPPVIGWIDPKITLAGSTPDGWHQSPNGGIGYTIGNSDSFVINRDGSVSIPNLFAGNLVYTNISFTGSFGITNLTATNIVASTAAVQTGTFNTLQSSNINVGSITASIGVITNLSAGVFNVGTGNFVQFNTGAFNSPTGTISSLTAYSGSLGNVTVSNLFTPQSTIINGTAGTLTVTNLIVPTGTITTLGANTINSPTATINSLTSLGINSTAANIGSLSTPQLTATAGTAGNLTITNLTSPNGTITTLNANTVNAPVGNFTALNALNAALGNTTVTNGTFQIATIGSGTAGNLTVTNLIAPSATITTIGANTVNAPTATLNNLNSTALTSVTGTIGNLTTPQLTAIAGTAGTLTVTNLLSPTATITTLGAGSVNAATGTVSTLTAYALNAGSATITNATLQQASLPNATGGNVTITNLSAPNAAITTLSAGSLSAPSATVTALTANSLNAGNSTITNVTIQGGTILNANAGNLVVTNLSSPTGAISTFSASTINSPVATINQVNSLNVNSPAASIGLLIATNLNSPNAVLTLERVGSSTITNLYALAAYCDSINSPNYTGTTAGFVNLNAGTLNVTNSFAVNGDLPVGGTVTAKAIVGTNTAGPALTAGGGGLLLTGSSTNNTVLYAGPLGGFHVWDKNITGSTGRVFNLSVSSTDIQFLVGGANPNPRNVSFGGDFGSGTNIKGAEMSFKAPQGSGNNTSGGNIHFYTPDATASGTTVQAISEKFTIVRDGGVIFRTPPATPAPGPGRTYSDGTNFYYSDNSYAWMPVVRSRPASGLTTFNFNTVAVDAQVPATATITSAVQGDSVIVNPRAPLPVGIIVAFSRVSANNTVEITLQNTSANPINVGSVQFDVKVLK